MEHRIGTVWKWIIEKFRVITYWCALGPWYLQSLSIVVNKATTN